MIWGLDPGGHHTGYGFVSVKGDRLEHVESGVIHLPQKLTLPERLALFYEELRKLAVLRKPSYMVVENVFLGKNVKSAFSLGHFRGVALQVGAQFHCKMVSYSPRKVKKVVTGYGASSKKEVGEVVSKILNVKGFETDDVSDALALCLCHHYCFEEKKKILLMEEI